MAEKSEVRRTLTSNVVLVELARLRGHERTDETRCNALKAEIESDGMLFRPIVVDEKTNVVLDGHHRLAALKRLGCLKIPVCYVIYTSDNIGVMSMLRSLKITKPMVVQAALSEDPFPPKTTWHYVNSDSRTLNHISCIQRRIDVPLERLH